MYGKMQESGLIEIFPLICILGIQGQYPIIIFSPSWVPFVAKGFMAGIRICLKARCWGWL